MTELCHYKGTKATFDEKSTILWIGVSECPTKEDIDHMWTTVSTFVRNYPEEVIIHIEHILTDTLDSLPVPTMMHILGIVAKEELKLQCIIFQARQIDEKVNIASGLFGTLNPSLKLKVCDAETFRGVLDKVERRRQKKLNSA